MVERKSPLTLELRELVHISEERGVRYLHLGSRWIQGAMRIARPWSLELEYTRAMMMVLLFRAQAAWPRSVLQIGLGAGSITKFLYRNVPKAKLTVVEISPEVVTVAWQFFQLPDDPARLSIEIEDGYAFLASTCRRFDLILIDGFDAKGHAGMLDTVPFYGNCLARLGDSGMMAVNLLSRRKGAAASIERLGQVFGERVLALPPCEAGNTIALAAAGARHHVSLNQLRASARALKTGTGLNLMPTVERLILGCRPDGDEFIL